MSAKATPTDNAVIESFFATLKNECVNKQNFSNKKEAINKISKFIDYYNNLRIQLKTSATPREIRTAAVY